VLLALLLAACNPFEPREAESPAATVEWNPFPVSPQLAVDNLRYAWLYPQNATKYGELLAEGFAFVFAQQDVVEYGVPSQWAAADEKNTLLNLTAELTADSKTSVVFFEISDEEDVIHTDDATIKRDYAITAHVGSAGMQMMAAGTMTLDLVRGEDGLWRIELWQDNRKTDDTMTWGRLKDAYRP